MRVPSARSSVAYDDYPSHLHPHALRSVSSRFSLGDFAATRSEFDFDDDASSIFERATVASEAGDVAGDKFVAVGGLNLDLDQVNGPGQMVIEHREEDDEGGSSGDYYDLLCLPRDPLLTPRRIRRAYWTLLALLLDDTYPENLSPLATAYLNQAQQAFETLIDPARRVHYDMRSRAWLITDDDSQKENFEELYEDALVHHQWLVQRRDFESSAVTLRLDASALVQGARQLGNRNVLLQPLDFALSQSVTTALPHFRRFLMSLVDDRRLASHVRATGALTELTAAPNIYLPAPELTLSGSAYGLFDVVAIPTSLPDLIHPLHTPLTPSPKLQRLAPRAFSPGVNLDLHQDILRRTADGGVLKSFVQFYCDPLGRRLGTRLSHEVAVGKKPLTIEVNTQSSRIASQTLSQAAAGLSYSVANGLAYISAGSDGWRGDMIGTLSANQNRKIPSHLATNGIVLATEKKSSSPLADPSSLSKISLVTPNIGMVYSGMGPDYRVLVDKARKVSHTGYKRIYNEYPPTRILVQDVAKVMQEATQSGGVRPYGVSLLIAGWDEGILPEDEEKEAAEGEEKKPSGKTGGILKGGPMLYQVDPSGSYFPWKATAIGKSATSAKTFLEKRYTEGLELEDAVHIALLTLKETIEGEMSGETIEIDHKPQDWESMEATMRTHYEREQREIQIMEQIEASESAEYEEYVVESTNARLDFENAKAHLSHFCGQLSPGEYIDKRPEYIPRVVDNGVPPSLRVTVLLPSYVPAAVRHAESRRSWKSEHQASKDAAFQAYVALYEAGLVNEHMLPLTAKDIVPANEPRVATLQVNGLLNVWLGIAQAWITSTETWLTLVHLRDATGLTRGTYIMRIPVALPALPSTPVYFDREGPWLLDFGPQERKENLEMPDHTSVLLALHFGHRWSIAHGQQQVISFASQDGELNISQLSARVFTTADADREEMLYLVRDESGCPYVYDHFLNGKPSLELVQRPFRRIGDSPGFQDAPSNIPYLALRKWPRYLALLHQQNVNDLLPQATNKKPYARVHPAPWAKVDTIPLDHAYFGALIPFISHIVEVRLVAEQLSSSLLRDLNFSDPSLVLAAISTKGSLEATNYERLELLGDSILKLCTTANAAALLSNSRLCRAALDAGLDRFVLTENFTCRTWRPIYVNDMMEKGARNSGPRTISTKTLADIVEALIGAAYIDGGLPKALGCISIFLRELDWKPLPACQKILYSLAPPDVPLPPMLVPLEDLIGYTFTKKSLLIEAITHASFTVGHVNGCLERLEFLGDAILDDIVVSHLFPLNLSHDRMHLLKTASVNGDLLGFLALECHAEEDEVIIDIDFSPSDTDFNPQNSAGVEQKLKQTRRKIPLWKFMRHSSIEVVQQQTKAASVHADLRGQIMHALEHGSSYPWSLLARLHPAKFFSDMVEAVLGAVWVDSGDMGACIRVAERLGILPVLSRLAKEDVHVLHPKQELGEIAGPRTVEYLLTLPEDAAGLQSATRKYACKVMVGDRCVAEVDDGVARDEVETKAAEVAVQTLKNEQADAKQAAEH
ncbi:Dicer-like protein 2 like [Verticillium longisporum]|nr:Dicer-like protein 2 like [Verticillium longisporum]